MKRAADDAVERLLRGVIERPVSVSIAALALVVLGLVSLWRLPVSLLPSLERPRLEVRLVDRDLGRDELLHGAVRPLERALASLPGVLDVLARVGDGEATLTVETEWQTDVDRLRIDAERRLAGAGVASLDELTVRVLSGDAEPILRLAVGGGSGSAARTEFAENVLVPELGRLPGAGDVRLLGTARRQVVVRPRAADLAARGLTAADVRSRLEGVGRDVPLGTVRQGGRLRPLVVREPLHRLDDLARLRLAAPGEDGPRQVLLGDVADLRFEEVPDGTVALWWPGRGRSEDGNDTARDVVLVDLHRAPGANAVLLARAAREAISELQRRSDARLDLHVVHDASSEVVAALAGLGRAALLGLILGTLVLRAFLGRWRPTLSLAVVVPASLVSAFGAFLLGGISLDLVSLAGLALAAGMLVDNSVVVLEAITSSRERGDADPVVAGTRQIAMALVAAFLTTAVVFLPLLYLHGLARAFFGVQAFAIVSSLAISLLLSLSLTPVLAGSRSRGRADGEPAGEEGETKRRRKGRNPGQSAYLRLLDGALRRPLVTLAATLVLLGGAAWLAAGLPAELVPTETTSGLRADLRFESGLEREAAWERLGRVAAELGVGQASSGDGRPGELILTYRAREANGHAAGSGELEWTALGASSPDDSSLASATLAVPGVEGELEPRRGAVSAAVERSGRRLRVVTSASTPERTEALAARVAEALAAEGFDARPVRQSGAPVGGFAGHQAAYRLEWRALRRGERAALQELGRQVTAGLGGVDAGRVEIEGVDSALRLEATSDELGLLPVRSSASGGVVPLAAVARTGLDAVPPPDERRNGRPTRRLELPRGTDVERLDDVLRSLPLAVDESAEFGGTTRELRRAFSQLRLALGLALVLVFLTVAALYESLALPLAVMTTVPVAAAGALAALAATGGSLNVMSLLGVILLTGIVVNNGIVLVHRVEQLRAGGLALADALRGGAAERYRPILLTTLTTLLGMLPLALLGGEGAELRRSLATAVCGGLLTSWAGALLVVPALYALLRRGRPA